MKTEINLLKNELKERGPLNLGEKNLTPLYLSIAALLIMALGYGGMIYYHRTIGKQISAAEIEAANLDMEMRSTDSALDEAINYQLRLSNLSGLLGAHTFWSPVFEELAKYTYTVVSFDTFNSSADEASMVVTGNAPTYTDIAKLILGLKQSGKFQEIIFQSAGKATGERTGFGFTLDVNFDPQLLKRQ